MPSINRPTWRGVSTTREQSTIHRLGEELRRLEQSTVLLRQNLENATTNRINNSSENIDTSNVDLHDLLLSEECSNRDDLPNVLQSLEKSSEQLKLKIQSVLKSNAEFKTETKSYFEQSEAWNIAFHEESKKIDAELQQVVISCQTSTLYVSAPPGKLAAIITNKARNWCNLFQNGGRSVLTDIRRKWESVELRRILRMPENINHDASYYELLHNF